MSDFTKNAPWHKLPAIAVVQESIRFLVAALKDVSTTIWIWISLFLLLKNVVLVALVMVLGLLSVGICLSAVKSHYTRFRFTDLSVEIESGVLSRRHVRIPYPRILNVEINQHWIYSFGDVVSATFDSAGNSRKDGLIPGLNRVLAEQAKALTLSNELTEYQINDDEKIDTGKDKPVIQRSSWDIFVFGMCHNRIFLFFGLTIGLYFKVKEVVKNIDEYVLDIFANLIPEGSFAVFVVGSLAGLLFLVVSAIGSGALQLIQSFGYTLEKSDKDLSQFEGFFTKKRTHVQLKKLQWVMIRETVLDRLIGRCSMQLAQMSNAMTVPALRRNEVSIVMDAVYPQLQLRNNLFCRMSFYRVIKAFFLYSLPLAYVCYVSVVELSRYGFGAVFMSGAVLVTAISFSRWYRHGYYSDQEFVFFKQGRFDQTLYCLHKSKIQCVFISQSVFQKMLGIASIELSVAGKNFKLPGVRLKSAIELKNEIMETINERNWL